MRRELARRSTVPPKRYGSLASFYRADARRVESRELDIGLWWREGDSGCLHRAAWVSDTGELYLVRLGPDSAGGGRVEILATVPDRDRLEMILEGWRERCGEPGSLTWLRERAGRLHGRARVNQVRMAAGTGRRGARLAPLRLY
jgi:hypothetical protein